MVDNVLAVRHHLPFGVGYVWTFGPLGFLDHPAAVSRTMLLVADGALLASALLLAGLAVAVMAVVLRWPPLAVALACLLLFLPAGALPGSLLFTPLGTFAGLEFVFPLAALLLLALEGRLRGVARTAAVLAAGPLMAAGPLVKANVLPWVAPVALLWCLAAVRDGRARLAALFAGSALAAWLGVFIALGGGPLRALQWPVAIIPLITGYATMSLHGRWSYLVLAVASWALGVGTALYILWGRWRPEPADWLLPAAALLWFISFKEGFVRQDTHVFVFLGVLPWSTLLLALWARLRSRPRVLADATAWTGAAVAAVILINVAGTALGHQPGVAARWRALRTAAAFIGSQRAAAEIWRTQDAQGLAAYGLAPLVPRLAGQRAFAWPWDGNAVLAADGSEAIPPVPQEYSAYTPGLDARDAAWFSAPGRPPVGLVVAESIDGRLPLNTAPRSLFALLACYRPGATTGMWLLVVRRPCAGPPPIRWQAGTRQVPLGAAITIPRTAGRLTVAAITIQPSLAGRVAALFFRQAPAQLLLGGGPGAGTYRLVAATAREGIVVSTVATTVQTLRGLWRGGTAGPSSLAVIAPVPVQWKRTASVRFGFVRVAPP